MDPDGDAGGVAAGTAPWAGVCHPESGNEGRSPSRPELPSRLNDRQLTERSGTLALVEEPVENRPRTLEELEQRLKAERRRDPHQAWYPFLLGQIEWSRGKRAAAESYWSRTIAIKPALLRVVVDGSILRGVRADGLGRPRL